MEWKPEVKKVVTFDDCSIAQGSSKATNKDDFEHHCCLRADFSDTDFLCPTSAFEMSESLFI